MDGITNLWAFMAAGLLLNLTPGPDTFYILGRSTAQGSRVGLLSALGIGLGSVGHTLLAAFGLSALLAASAMAFLAVKLLGAGYLLYLGVKMLRQPGSSVAGDAARLQAARPGKILREAFFTNLFNPKVALFFLAFLPQFVKPGATAVSFVILGLTFVATGLLWCAALALLSARLGEWLRRKGVAQRLDQLCGGLFILLGINLLFARLKP
ncbi:LysE family translocator [Aquitalea magnusonii]|uniref:Threonine/homoserine/homoserine lactone efflux protein n=1 Tax=Aquitalea magnusonii TaxID=332411 RepID=A0A318JLI4_9NEIS|nr:LysE family translocator [Aquitalea magnusonii]PXX48069.1 threonine/homoserine/homoserine lactone efflux protein [Aquitalea magnusonii]